MMLKRRQGGFTLVELLIAITLSMLILAALSVMFVTSSRARDEITRANQQIENGRYALQVLSDDLQMAGYFAEYIPPTPTAAPNPCALALPDLTTQALQVQGFNTDAVPGVQVTVDATCTTNIPATSSITAMADRQPGTDIIVVRRVSGCAAPGTDCDVITNAPYFQASLCNAEVALGTGNNQAYRLGTGVQTATVNHNTATTRHARRCHVPHAPPAAPDNVAANRRFLTHVYFVTSNNAPGDGIPTLKRAELGPGLAFTVIPIAEGIEDLQFEYGIDSSAGGGAVPGTYAFPASVADWTNVTTVEVHLLARSSEPSPGHVDDKTYVVGPKTILPANIPAAQKAYKRHVFTGLVQLSNIAVRRQ